MVQELPAKRGDPPQRPPGAAKSLRESITALGCCGWESEGPVVALKWGNAHGAKGPWYT